ncbi:MAG: hypothetical protein R3A13_00265 [Bdellovibrionota bacterium]
MIFKLDEWLNKPVYIPPRIEQEKIVRILKCADAEIEVVESIIKSKELFKKGLMLSLWRGRDKNYHLGSLKASPIGLVPASWEVVSIGEVCTTFSGGTHHVVKRNFLEETYLGLNRGN